MNTEVKFRKDYTFKEFFKKFIPRIILLDVFLVALIFAGICGILSLFGLMFRQWVFAVMAVVLLFPGLVGLFQLLGFIKQRILKLVLSWLVIIGTICGTPIVLILGYLYYTPEHIVNHDGEKYVVYVSSYIKTNVRYYEYHNFLVCGEYPRIEEVYDGGVDPYKNPEGKEYVPEYTLYYDEHHNLIKEVP